MGLSHAAALKPDLREATNSPSDAPVYKKDARGRKPKAVGLVPRPPKTFSADLIPELPVGAHPYAGKLTHCLGSFFHESNSGWGSNLDTIALAHGPVGCGAFTQASRLSAPGLVQGVESFTELHACTDLRTPNLEDGGDARLARALDELESLFPLARGTVILNEDPIALVDANPKGVAKEKSRDLGKPVLSRSCESIRSDRAWAVETASGLKAAVRKERPLRSTRYDVALPFSREATGLVWVLSKLLREIGLNPFHELTASSTSDMARIGQCKLVIGFAPKLDVPSDYFPGGAAQLLRQWFNLPLVWTCFAGPSATDASLRAIAASFDWKVRARAEQVIAANRAKVEAIVARYRPRLQGKLVAHFYPMTDEQLEPYRLLGFRIGNASGWTGKTGKWRKPSLVCDPDKPRERAIESYIAEAKPDLVLAYGRDEYEWRKRGQRTLPRTLFCNSPHNAYWAYDGFAKFAETLNRELNAPWLKLIKSPWATGGGQ
ncbi:nitrogenase component 1 [Methylocystis parvus]|uniref:nitrogenase component 1 n=1 Tax=Methylocystis parvus TaxID=134 RepID=UPI001FCB6A2F|nr:nitrogenase component 1 [Methylocystis parvus]WBK02283.1 nitrogenase [Methylocystis parvus OBBP]